MIDETTTFGVSEPDWALFRSEFPDRPFCLLQPVPTKPGLDVLNFPSSFFDDPINIFDQTTREAADITNPSDWYDLCDLESRKAQGLTNVVLFVDNSGSLITANVQNAFDLFAQRVAMNGFTIVSAVENFDEDYISPCLETSLLI